MYEIYILTVLVTASIYSLFKLYKNIKKTQKKLEEKKIRQEQRVTIKDYIGKKESKKKIKIEDFKKFIEIMKKETETYYFKIDLEEIEYDNSLFTSKIGGLPYLDKSSNLLLDDEGDPMYLLAQINFEELPTNTTYPKKGLLQFYIKADNMYGLEMEDKQNLCQNHKVIFIENIDKTITKDEIKSKYILDKEKYYELPLLPDVSLKMNFILSKEFGNSGDIYFENYLIRRYNEIFNAEIDNFYDLSNAEIDYITDEMYELKTKISGYAGFTQDDVREYGYTDYEVLLLQIDSEQDYIMWGDCGIANFFITKEDLERKDFSKVLYNWDCY